MRHREGTTGGLISIDHVRIYVLRDDVPIGIGTVSARSTRQFTLSPAMIGSGTDLGLRAETLSPRNAVDSPQMGTSIAWEVEPALGITLLSLN